MVPEEGKESDVLGVKRLGPIFAWWLASGGRKSERQRYTVDRWRIPTKEAPISCLSMEDIWRQYLFDLNTSWL